MEVKKSLQNRPLGGPAHHRRTESGPNRGQFRWPNWENRKITGSKPDPNRIRTGVRTGLKPRPFFENFIIFDGTLGGHIAPDRHYRRLRGWYRRGCEDGGHESLSTASPAFAGVAVRTVAKNPDRRPRPRSRRIIFNKFLKIVSRFVFKLFFLIFD